MAFWVDAARRVPGSGRVRKTVASGLHAGYPTGMTAKTTRRAMATRCPDSTFTLPEAVRATLRGDRAKG